MRLFKLLFKKAKAKKIMIPVPMTYAEATWACGNESC